MTWKIIVADFTCSLEWEPLIARLSHLQNEISFVYSTLSEDFLLHLNSPETVGLVIAAEEFSPEVENAYRQYQQIVGCLPEFLALICDEPSPRFVVSIFEFGIENIIRKEHIVDRFEILAQVIKTTLSDESTPEFHAINLALGLRTSNQALIQNAGTAMKAIAGDDYRAAYVAGRALEAQGVYGEAERAYKLAFGINKMFRPGSSSLAEALMVTGKVDEAVAILERMEKSNPRDISRKSTLIAAYTEQGQTEKAAKALAEAAEIAPDHPKLVEAKVNIMLAEGKIVEAFNLMPQMENAGVLFASRLNDMGIRLSKEGKAKQALALYNKAHKIIRQDLRYKLSMNCALACRRLGDFEMALKYLARCKKEFGKSFDKLDQIIVATKLAIEQQKGSSRAS